MKTLYRIMALLMVVCLLAGCGAEKSSMSLNGVDISKYAIVYPQEGTDYCQRAAQYIHDKILERTGVDIPVYSDSRESQSHEIILGQTNRPLSRDIAIRHQDMKFAIKADKNHIALNAQSFIIAAAAYYFVETYIPGNRFQSEIPVGKIAQCEPITEKPNNFIYLIGDGMGINHTKLPEQHDIEEYIPNSDFEDIFYGYYLPYQGVAHTNSLSGTTDSAAGATALACGIKTINGIVGRDQYGNDAQSLTELAISLGMATAVMSSDAQDGATPAGFSAHAADRSDSADILACQEILRTQSATVFACGLYTEPNYETVILDVLHQVEQDPEGFFLMYEEGYIDKKSHNNDMGGTLMYMGRFNQAIGVFMEYAFYNPDTFLIITADHETGGLQTQSDGLFGFTTGNHTAADVPVFAYGQGAEAFDNYNEENNEIPKVIAALWGVHDFAAQG